MIGSNISELAASKKSTLIAAAFGEKTVQVWDLKSQKAICEFAAVFVMGARNLALAPDAGILVTGLSGAHGAVAAYEVPSGKKLWDRKRLVYPSYLEFDSTGRSIFCTVNDRRRLLRLEVGSGTTQRFRRPQAAGAYEARWRDHCWLWRYRDDWVWAVGGGRGGVLGGQRIVAGALREEREASYCWGP